MDGWGSEYWGGRGLAGAEVLVGGMGALVLLMLLLIRKPARVPVASEQTIVLG